MAVISFSDDSSDAAWVVAGWAFRQVLTDTMAAHPDDAELASRFQRAIEVGYLRLGRMESEPRRRLAAAISSTAEGVLAGTTPSGILDGPGTDDMKPEYLRGLQLLLEATRKE